MIIMGAALVYLYSSGGLDGLLSGKPTYVCKVGIGDPCEQEVARMMRACENTLISLNTDKEYDSASVKAESRYGLTRDGENCRVDSVLQKLEYKVEKMSGLLGMVASLLEATLDGIKKTEGKHLVCTYTMDEMAGSGIRPPAASSDSCSGELKEYLAKKGGSATAIYDVDSIFTGPSKGASGSGSGASSGSDASGAPSGGAAAGPEDKFDWAATLGCGYGSHSDSTVNSCLDELYEDAKKDYALTLTYDGWYALRPERTHSTMLLY